MGDLVNNFLDLRMGNLMRQALASASWKGVLRQWLPCGAAKMFGGEAIERFIDICRREVFTTV